MKILLSFFNNYFLIRYIVAIGEFDSKTDPDCNSLFCGHKVEYLNISYIVKHPNYRADNFENNIALIRLEKSITFKGTAQPVCLLPREIYIETVSNVILIGWGRLSNQKGKDKNKALTENFYIANLF